MREREFIRRLRAVALVSQIAGAATLLVGLLARPFPCWPPILVGLAGIVFGAIIASLMVAFLVD